MVYRVPESYRQLSEEELLAKIRQVKATYGPRLVILAHHYQRHVIKTVADYRGDSFELCKYAASGDQAEYIVFCGVHFMAESAAILKRPDQRVFLPDLSAGCPMADMADRAQVEWAWEELTKQLGTDRVTPVTYMNSDALLKAFTGREGGAVCTSSNGEAVFRWAFEQREKVFFFPDEHLGRNIALALGVSHPNIVVWDPAEDRGGLTETQLETARVILWKGHCHVHTWFTVDHLEHIRAEHPGVRIVVHPECSTDVMDAADARGSTSFIVRYVEEAPTGSTIAIGTDMNLTASLAIEHPDKQVIELSRSMCPNMWKVSVEDLAFCLDHLGEINEVEIPDDVSQPARMALQRMLQTTNDRFVLV